jgi:hypothetical protein
MTPICAQIGGKDGAQPESTKTLSKEMGWVNYHFWSFGDGDAYSRRRSGDEELGPCEQEVS